MTVSFLVEQAGCEGCAELLRGVFAPLATGVEISIDEADDVGSVHLEGTELTKEQVGSLLRDASAGSGHTYSVRAGSFAQS